MVGGLSYSLSLLSLSFCASPCQLPLHPLMSSQKKGIVRRVGLSLSAASASRSLSVKVTWQDDENDDGRVRVGGGQAGRLAG
ncbi:hypothetical protein T484DRAFT_1966151 [Baffinella frigidus]|nr:hypothetical protein T484DRAFT_1989184 [Cryptophyta sp. CCMP2293]KAJ1476303.1 hypothetical protein T484DRAFT_1966151 [Cryptophyta sp. CCMP2293]